MDHCQSRASGWRLIAAYCSEVWSVSLQLKLFLHNHLTPGGASISLSTLDPGKCFIRNYACQNSCSQLATDVREASNKQHYFNGNVSCKINCACIFNLRQFIFSRPAIVSTIWRSVVRQQAKLRVCSSAEFGLVMPDDDSLLHPSNWPDK